MKPLRYPLSLIFLIVIGYHAHAANRFWVAAAPGNWSSPANWSAASGGAPNASVPGAADNAIFDNNGLGNCTLNINVTVISITMNASYTGNFIQGANTITTTGNATFSGGTFSGGSANITIGGVFILSGTSFTSTSSSLEFRSNTAFTSGSFAHNNGSVRYNCAASITITGTSPTFNNLEFVGNGRTYTISSAGDITVLGSLNLSGASSFNLNTGTIDVNGDINVSNTSTACGGNTMINIIGTGAQNFVGSTAAGQGTLPQLTINKSSGSLNLSNFPGVANNFTYTAGTINAGTSTFCFARASTGAIAITGSVSLNHIYFVANTGLTATIAAGTILTVNNLTTAGTANLVLNTGTINVSGDISLTNTGTAGGGSATINIIGASNQSIDGSLIAANQNRLPIININKPGGTLSLAGNITFAANVTYVAGIINPTNSTCVVANTITVTGTFSIYNLTVNSTAGINLNIAAGNTLTVANDLTLANNASTININTGTLEAKGNIIITNTAIAGGGSGTLLISGSNPQNMSATGVINQGRLPAVTINKTGSTLTLPSLITVRGNWTYTAGTIDAVTNNSTVVFENTLTITGSHTLNNVRFEAAGNYTITTAAGTTLTVNGSMMLANSNNLTFTGGNINLNGDLNLNNTGIAGGGTTVISFTGATNQAITGSLTTNQSRLPAITINKSSGTLTLPALITVRGNWTYIAGVLDATTNNSNIVFNNSLSFTGTHSLNNVTLEGSANNTFTVNTGTLLTVTGTLFITGASNVSINAPVNGTNAIAAQGDISISNTGAGGGGTAAILINGTANQALTSTAAAAQGRLPYLNIQKTSGTLSLNGIISESRDWTYTSGTVDPTTSTIVFGGNNLTINSAGMSFNNITVTSATSTLGNNLTVNNNITINGTGVLSGGANTINIAGNWTNRATAGFTESTSTVNFNGSSLQTVTTPGGENFTNLIVNNSGTGIQFGSNATVATTLTMTQGNIDLNANTVSLGTSTANIGTLTRTTGTMINSGSFRRWFNTTKVAAGSIAGLFPVGTATNYRPFSLSNPTTGPTTGGTITISYTDANTNSVTSFPDGVFTVVIRKDLNWNVTTANGLNGGSYDLSIQGTGYGKIGNVSDLRLTLANSVVGTAGVNSGSNSNPTVNRTAVAFANLSNTFYIASVNLNGTTLPVSYISFTASTENGLVKLDWKTSAELNNDHFTVQRSANGINWEDVKTIEGSGNTSTVSSYTVYDENPFSGISYYRVMQTDMDGKQSYSVIKIVDLNKTAVLNVYPNPATDYIIVSGTTQEKLNVLLFNSNGQRMNVPTNNNGMKSTLYVSGIVPGIYFIRIMQGNSTEVRKITIVK